MYIYIYIYKFILQTRNKHNLDFFSQTRNKHNLDFFSPKKILIQYKIVILQEDICYQCSFVKKHFSSLGKKKYFIYLSLSL